jgi:hypothetical protein
MGSMEVFEILMALAVIFVPLAFAGVLVERLSRRRTPSRWKSGNPPA